MSLIKLWHKKNGSHQTKKYLLPLFTALCTAALFFTGCANSADSIDSSDGKKEKFTITVKTQNLTSKKEDAGRSIFPVLSGSENYTLSYKSGENADWQNLDGTFPDYQMFIIPGTYTLKLDAYSDSEKQNHILTGQTELTVTSGMENAEVLFIVQPPESTTGNGSVSLILSAESDTKIDKFEITADSGDLSLVWTKADTETTYTKGTITAASVPNGTYHLTIYGKTTAGETIYVRSETLTVWSGLESSAWIFADGSSSNELKITASDLYSTFYVKGSSDSCNFYKDDVFGDVTASDTNSGSIDCPLQTVSAAVNKCVVSNKPYTIYVDGTVNEVNYSSSDPTAISISSGKKITIKSLPIGEKKTKAVIQANGNGRIMYAGGTVVLEDLVLKGGGNTNLGGGIYVGQAEVLTMKNCTITGCNATTSGGGLYIASNGSANLSGCTISYCRCIGGGGGIYIASGVTATLIGCTIQKNYTRDSTGAGSGGGILNYGTLNITDCKFISNDANCGGGIQTVGGGTVTITGIGEDTCVFQYNKANSGGAIHTKGTVTAEKVKFESNSSGVSNGGGGGLWIEGSSSNVTLTDCNLSNNKAANLGGAVWVSSGSLTMADCTISSNTAQNGGGIYSTKSITFTDCTFSGNTATSNGKAVYFAGGTLNLNEKIQSSTDDFYIPTGKYITIQTPLSDDSSVLVTPSDYINNTQILQAEDGVTLSDEAGKFKISNTDYIISKEGKLCYLGTNSTTAEDNIAVFTNIPAGCEATVNLDNLAQTTWNNHPSIEINGKVTVKATSSKAINSEASCIFTVKKGGTLTLESNVTLNTTVNNPVSCVKVEEGGTLILDGAEITSSSTTNPTGVSITKGKLIIKSGTISDIKGSPIVATDSEITITGGTISNNRSTSSRSTVSLKNCTADITNLTVTENSANWYGGGIMISGGGTYTFTSCVISNNSTGYSNGAPGYGGGIYIDTTGTVTFTGCTITGNSAINNGSSSKGGGIYLKSGTLTTTDCTINSNTTKNGSTVTSGYGSQIYAVKDSVYNGETLAENKVID